MSITIEELENFINDDKLNNEPLDNHISTTNVLEKLEKSENSNEIKIEGVQNGIYETPLPNQSLMNTGQTVDMVKARNKLISNIELFETQNVIARKIKYPPSCNYEYGLPLEACSYEQLQKIHKIQTNIHQIESLSTNACTITYILAGLLETKVNKLKGYQENLLNQSAALKEAYRDVLLEYDDEIQEWMSPSMRLGFILFSSAALCYVNNSHITEAKNNNNNNYTESPNVNDDKPISTNVTNPPVVKRPRGRPRKYY